MGKSTVVLPVYLEQGQTTYGVLRGTADWYVQIQTVLTSYCALTKKRTGQAEPMSSVHVIKEAS